MKLVRRRHPHPEIPLVSTADVAFLLLIFFLATAIFSTQRGILLALPAPDQATVRVSTGDLARIEVGADRSVRLDGVPIAAPRLRASLRDRLADRPDLIVSLAIHPRAPYAALVETLDQIKLSGARRIALRTRGAS